MKYAILLSVMLVAGCAQVQEAKTRAVDYAREAADAALNDGIFLVCDAPTAGALRRRFGDNEGLATKWREFCDMARAGATVGP